MKKSSKSPSCLCPRLNFFQCGSVLLLCVTEEFEYFLVYVNGLYNIFYLPDPNVFFLVITETILLSSENSRVAQSLTLKYRQV